MQIIHAEVPSNATIYFPGDLHVGCLSHMERPFARFVEKIRREKNSRVVWMGDLIEGFAMDDKRFHRERNDVSVPNPLKQAMYVREHITEPLEDKSIVLLEGNHERHLHRFGDLSRDVMAGKIPFGTYTSIIDINKSFKILAWHGTNINSCTAGNMLRRAFNRKQQVCTKLGGLPFANCLVKVMGHVHFLSATEPYSGMFMSSSAEELTDGYYETHRNGYGPFLPDQCWYASTGCWKGSYVLGTTGYEEERGFGATERGTIKLTLKNDKIVGMKEVFYS